MRHVRPKRRILTAYAPPKPREWQAPYRKRNARRLAMRKLRARLDDGRRFLLFCKNRPDWLLWWADAGLLAAVGIMMLDGVHDAFVADGITGRTLILFMAAGHFVAVSMLWWCFIPGEKLEKSNVLSFIVFSILLCMLGAILGVRLVL